MTDQGSVVQRARAMLLKRREIKESEAKSGVRIQEEKIKGESVEPVVETKPEVFETSEFKEKAVEEVTPAQVKPQVSPQETQATIGDQSDKESFVSAKEEPQATSKSSTSTSSTARPAVSAPVKPTSTSTPLVAAPMAKSATMEPKKLDVHAFFQPGKTVPPPSTAAPPSRLFKVASNDAFRDANAARAQPIDNRASWGRQQFPSLSNPPSYRSPPPPSLRQLFSPPPISATVPGAFYPSAQAPVTPAISATAFIPSTQPAYPQQNAPALDNYYPPSPPLWEPARPSKGVTLSRSSFSSAPGPTPSSSTSVSPSVSRGMVVPESETVDSQDEEQFYYPSETSTQAMSPSTDSPEMSNTLSSLQLSLAIKDAHIPKDLPIDDPRFSTVYSLLHSTLVENAKLSLRLEEAQKRIEELRVGSEGQLAVGDGAAEKKEETSDQSAINQEAISLVVDLEEDLNTTRSQLDLLLTKLNEAYSDYIELATSSCTLIQSELTIQEDLVDRINQVEHQYNNLRRRAIEKVEAAQQELETARKQVKSQQSELEMLAGVKQQVETLQIALDTSEKQNQQNDKKLEDAVQKSQKLHQKSDDLIQNCQGMQREIVGLAARARKAEQTCKEKKAEYNQTVVRQAKESQALEQKLEQTERAFSTLKTRFEKVEKERNEATMLLAELTKGDSDKGSGNEEEEK